MSIILSLIYNYFISIYLTINNIFHIEFKYFKNFRLSESELIKNNIDQNINDIITQQSLQENKKWFISKISSVTDMIKGFTIDPIKNKIKELIFKREQGSDNIIHYLFAYFYWFQNNINFIKSKELAVTGGVIITTGSSFYILEISLIAISYYLALLLLAIIIQVLRISRKFHKYR